MPFLKESLKINTPNVTEIFSELKTIYDASSIEPSRKEYITSAVREFGYLPYPHIKALEELTPAETIVGVEEKFKLNNTFDGEKFCFSEISPVKRAGFNDSSWIKTEQHNIKLTNLAGLGNGNNDSNPGVFIDWLKQLLILPSGNLKQGILSTTMYLIPFHPREFGCAYLPTSSGVSDALEDKLISEKLGLSAKEQVQLFLAFTQLAGHPTMFDVLPQTGRFSTIVLSNPQVARWFDVKELIGALKNDIAQIEIDCEPHQLITAKELVAKRLDGIYGDIPEEIEQVVCAIETKLDEKRKIYSEKMLEANSQQTIHSKVKQLIAQMIGKSENDDLTEADITKQGEITGKLIELGLWPAPGGAWCSAGIPVFDKMTEGAGYPLFKHFDHEKNDVTHFANLDCQTPYYFVHLENGQYNQKVIDFYVDFLKNLQAEYNFDGFRVDHIDHIVDAYSENKEGRPISYRAPRTVLGKANTELKKQVPHFAALAEYMLWDNFYSEYHNDMNFDLLWGNDIVSQFMKTPSQIVKDNDYLAKYNKENNTPHLLSVLKSYNNQDGEFEAIDQYPGQLGQQGALFKWFKFKFMPHGQMAQRPVMHIDGDESHTKKGIEYVIGKEESMAREKNYEFYNKFDAINRFARDNEFTRYGSTKIISEDEDGFISWVIEKEDKDECLFVTANSQSPTEKMTEYKEDGSCNKFVKEGTQIFNKKVQLPEGYKAVSKYELVGQSYQEHELDAENLEYETLSPSEFHIYKLIKL